MDIAQHIKQLKNKPSLRCIDVVGGIALEEPRHARAAIAALKDIATNEKLRGEAARWIYAIAKKHPKYTEKAVQALQVIGTDHAANQIVTLAQSASSAKSAALALDTLVAMSRPGALRTIAHWMTTAGAKAWHTAAAPWPEEDSLRTAFRRADESGLMPEGVSMVKLFELLRQQHKAENALAAMRAALAEDPSSAPAP